VNCSYISDNGTQIYSGSTDKTIKLWNVKTKKVVKSFEGHTDSVSTLHYANNKLISGSTDKSIILWDPNTGNCSKNRSFILILL
jgi:WD40 repeat protein